MTSYNLLILLYSGDKQRGEGILSEVVRDGSDGGAMYSVARRCRLCVWQ